MNWLVRLGQRLPRSWRFALARPPIAPLLRCYFNRFYWREGRIVVVELAAPLEGHQMKLDWQTDKAFVFGTYEPDVVTAIQRHLRPGMIAVDCRAHIGYHTLLMAKCVGKTGKVYAFEPLPENFSVLCENIALNGYEGIVIAEKKAVGAQTGRQHFRRGRWHPEDPDPLTSVSRLDPEGELEVEVVALDDYFVDERVDFIKVDVEGAEEMVLKGAQRLLRRWAPTLVVSIHSFSLTHPALMLLEGLGYEWTVLDGWGSERHVLARIRGREYGAEAGVNNQPILST
jgi:FkbM family methyltransferase